MAKKTGSASVEPGWWSWRDVVKNRHLLGIPHFQRGSVWDHGNRVALLESLFHASPCGSFVLWRPEASATDVGGPLLLSDANRGAPWVPGKALWLVDGQQRSRALLALYEELIRDNNASRHLICRGDLERLGAIWQQKTVISSDGSSDSLAEDDAFAADSAELDTDTLEVKQESDSEVSKVSPESIWFVSLPAMQLSLRKNGKLLFASWAAKTKTTRSSIFRLSVPALERLNDRGQSIPNPNAMYGLVPLTAMLAMAGENGSERRGRISAALQRFAGGTPDYDELQELVPWGPHFLRRFAGEVPANGNGVEWHTWRKVETTASAIAPVKELADLFASKSELFKAFRQMLDGARFAIGYLPSSSIREAVDAYVRINRAGIRVRTEERALAVLTRVNPHVLDGLNGYIKIRDGGRTNVDARAALSHDSDKELGFAPWMNTVVRYTALSLLGRDALRWLDAESIDQREFLTTLDRLVMDSSTKTDRARFRNEPLDAPALVTHAMTHGTAALALLDSVLSQELCFDHRMARPAIRPLIPVLELLYYVEAGLLEDWRIHAKANAGVRGALAGAVALSLMAPYQNAKEMDDLIKAIHAPDAGVPSPKKLNSPGKEESFRQGLARYMQALITEENPSNAWVMPSADKLRYWDRDASIPKRELPALASRISNLSKEAVSMNHPMLGWLYAVERRNKAREFSWKAQWDGFDRYRDANPKGTPRLGIPRPDATSGYREEALGEIRNGTIMGSLYPEKQHIVPFANIRSVLKDTDRGGRSAAHRIGNFTWLSSRQNGLDALSNRWTVIDEAKEGHNLAARGLSPKAIATYHRVRDALLQISADETPAQVSSDFDAFCELRREWLVDQVMGWFEEHTVALRAFL